MSRKEIKDIEETGQSLTEAAAKNILNMQEKAIGYDNRKRVEGWIRI